MTSIKQFFLLVVALIFYQYIEASEVERNKIPYNAAVSKSVAR